MYAAGDVSAADLLLVVTSADENPADEGRWFFGGGDLPLRWDYQVGHHLVAARLAELRHGAGRDGVRARDLVLGDANRTPVRRYRTFALVLPRKCVDNLL